MTLLSVLKGLISWIVDTAYTFMTARGDAHDDPLARLGQWVLGLWLFLSPAVLQFGMTGHAWNAYLAATTGIAWITASALAAFRPWPEWIAIALGAWLLISPWLLGFSDAAVSKWNAVVVGALVVVLAAWVLGQEHSPKNERRPRQVA